VLQLPVCRKLSVQIPNLPICFISYIYFRCVLAEQNAQRQLHVLYVFVFAGLYATKTRLVKRYLQYREVQKVKAPTEL